MGGFRVTISEIRPRRRRKRGGGLAGLVLLALVICGFAAIMRDDKKADTQGPEAPLANAAPESPPAPALALPHPPVDKPIPAVKKKWPKKRPASQPRVEGKRPVFVSEQEEKQAASALQMARQVLRNGNDQAALKYFEDVVNKYPDTQAAEAAAAEIERINK